MTFHQEWQHPECPVMDWYNQQRSSSTRFRSIEHRRSVQGPFYHEFLLLKLTDGSVCRIERVGDGSRTDAIRYIGCTAHDLIQHISKEEHEQQSANRATSVLITEVDLCQEFDILDVLAICFSIQKTAVCRVYTLQRYNCYFLCLTVLSVFTRRVANWEKKITNAQWDSHLDSVLAELSQLSPDDSNLHVMLRVCGLLEPGNSQSARFIFDGLREHLMSQAGVLDSFDAVMESTLYRAGWDSALRSVLTDSLEIAALNIVGGDSYCAKQLQHALDTDFEDSESALQSSSTLVKRYRNVHREEMAKRFEKTINIYQDLRRMWQVEHPISVGKRLLVRALNPLGGMFFALAPDRMLPEVEYKFDITRRLWSQTSLRLFKLRYGRLFTSVFILDGFGDSTDVGSFLEEAIALSRDNSIETVLTRILDELAAKGVLGQSEVSLLLAYELDTARFAELLVSLIEPGFGRALFSILDEQQPTLRLLSDNLELGQNFVTASDFQKIHIRSRIDAHARRVAAHQLAAAPLVVRDIENTMVE
ncbi:hypothetical protein FRC07_010743, partial [Ceratobasidium sp. 392]